jgi:hypothetical protein
VSEILALIEQALNVIAQLRTAFPIASLVVVLYGLSPLVAFVAVEAIKLARKEVGCRRLSRAALWVLSGLIGAVWSFRAGVVWFGEPLESVIFHALTVGLLTPVIILLHYRRIERRAPALAADLAQLRRRSTDRAPDPFDDTGERNFDFIPKPTDTSG